MGNHTNIEKMSREALLADLTPEQREFLDKVRAGKKDPVFFAENLLGVKLHDGQKLWLWMTTRTQAEQAYDLGALLGTWKSRGEFDELLARNPDFSKNILVPSNRWGKTLVTSVKHVWYNYYKVGVRAKGKEWAAIRCGTMNLSPHSNQAQAGFDYIVDILASKLISTIAGNTINNKCIIPDFYVSDSVQKRQIFFKNGTSYKAVPTGEDQASSLAGTPYLYISYDECAQSLHLKQELPAKIMSRLIDFGGPLDLVSTPEVDKPSHQYFFHISKLGLKGEEGWWTLLGKISDNIFLGPIERDRIAAQIRSTDPAKYRQVMFGEFVTTGKKMFDSILIERIWDADVPEMPKYEHKYLVIGDWGFADTGDPTVFYVLDYTECLNEKVPKHLRKVRISFREEIRGGSPFAVLARARMLQREWNGAKFLHDSGAMGGVIIKKMLVEMGMTDVLDFNAGGDKADMLFCLLMAMTRNRKTELDPENKVIELNPEFGAIRGYHITQLEEQMGNYQYNPEKGITDKKLEQDDVMCLGMGIWYLERKMFKNTVTRFDFNPFANRVEDIFAQKSGQKVPVRIIDIPEKRIW